MNDTYSKLTWENSLKELVSYFSKAGKKDLETVCLQVELSNEELKPVCPIFSNPIIHTKSGIKNRQQPGPWWADLDFNDLLIGIGIGFLLCFFLVVLFFFMWF